MGEGEGVILYADPNPGGEKIGNNWNFIKNVKVNLNQLHGFLLLRNIFLFFSTSENFWLGTGNLYKVF